MSTELDAVLSAVTAVNDNVKNVNDNLNNLRGSFDAIKDKISNNHQENTNRITALEGNDKTQDKSIAQLDTKVADLEKMVWRIIGGLIFGSVALTVALKFTS